MGSWCKKRQTDRVTSSRRRVGHLVAQISVVLHVVEVRYRFRSATQGRVCSNVCNALIAEPDLGVAVPKSFEVFGTISSAHRLLLKFL